MLTLWNFGCGIFFARNESMVKNKEEGKMKKMKNTQTDRRRRKEFASLILDG